MTKNKGKLAVVTGASTGIGYELAKCCAEDGFDLLIAADEPEIYEAAEDFKKLGVQVEAVEADLATTEGVDTLYAATNGRGVDALLANAGIGLGGAFLDQGFDEIHHIIDTNITGTIYLAQKIGKGEPWLLDLSRAFDDAGPIFFDWAHASPKGNQIIARHMSEALTRLLHDSKPVRLATH